jgi:hypothetical protein
MVAVVVLVVCELVLQLYFQVHIMSRLAMVAQELHIIKIVVMDLKVVIVLLVMWHCLMVVVVVRIETHKINLDLAQLAWMVVLVERVLMKNKGLQAHIVLVLG